MGKLQKLFSWGRGRLYEFLPLLPIIIWCIGVFVLVLYGAINPPITITCIGNCWDK